MSDSKYIDLLIENCLNLEGKNAIFIHYSVEVQEFVDKLVERIRNFNIKDIYLDKEDIYVIHDYLSSHDINDIRKSSLFNQSIWDYYAKRNASFLILETEYPGVLDDIAEEKIGACSKARRESRPIYRSMVEKCSIDWCIAAYPGVVWANYVFQGDEYAYDKLRESIFKCMMLDCKNPISSWNNYLSNQGKIIDYLNNLDIDKLHYSNSLGTSLDVYLPNGYLFSSARDRNVIVNMPSYEVFTSPIWNKTRGIVYSSKPLMYNGCFVKDFWIKFDGGRVVEYDAKEGLEILKSIIESDDQSFYLGECALVEKTSPIASSNITFGTTLLDENASCHLALGAGFPECIRGGLDMSRRELLNSGINVSSNHVDFMIGTDDLEIVGVTRDGRKVMIFEDGMFSREVLDNIG